MVEIVISVRAYCKMLLHMMKYPHSAVNGIFIAEEKKTHERGQLVINIVDSIPLFHTSLGLTPMLEVAFMQVDHYCKSKGLEIVGYYQGNRNYQDSSPDAVAFKVAEKVYENFNNACLVIVDNQKVSVECREVGFQLYQYSDNKWKLKDKTSVFLEQGHSALGIASTLLQSKVYRHLVDFDNHLDNITEDWTNQLLNEEIEHCL
ncbi:ER membrane protein complex subunit 8-like [Limulus polyphemus]|uniref:ER membrane protein complex subunit 8-like n=1 Tax=Limulus polyphemus TaxID=6850 RepID=A0ABM1SPN5_LIMPO|nr:ER membrane protein complex subunit 8-like [Limulus polyphemus]XP_013777984.1 ER membrane protein complex subunit 8-like [Limulus polyphemus]XP_022245591.1 ER membrane protein complex subunit 8-like [Limulus polyphemus]